MFGIHIDFDAALTLIRRVIATNGADYSPPGEGCIYVQRDGFGNIEPVCIMGHIFHGLGVSRVLLASSEWNNITTTSRPGLPGTCDIGAAFWHNAEQFGITASEDAKSLFRYTQAEQDSGTPWGQALTAALASLASEAEQSFEQEQVAAREAFASSNPFVRTRDLTADTPLAAWEKDLLGTPLAEGDTVFISVDAGAGYHDGHDVRTDGYVADDFKGATGTVESEANDEGNVTVRIASTGYTNQIHVSHLSRV